MASTTREQAGRGPVQPAFALTEMTVQGATRLYDLQMSALRALSETHARTAAAFGFPDWTEWLRNGSEESLRQATISSTQQVMETSRRAGEAMTSLGSNLRELLQAQTGAAAQQWQKVIEQFGAQTTESLERFREVTEGQSQRLMEETEARVEAIAAAMQDVGGAMQQDDALGEDPAKRGIHSNGAKSRSATRQH